MAHEDMALPMELFPGRFVRSACLPGASDLFELSKDLRFGGLILAEFFRKAVQCLDGLLEVIALEKPRDIPERSSDALMRLDETSQLLLEFRPESGDRGKVDCLFRHKMGFDDFRKMLDSNSSFRMSVIGFTEHSRPRKCPLHLCVLVVKFGHNPTNSSYGLPSSKRGRKELPVTGR